MKISTLKVVLPLVGIVTYFSSDMLIYNLSLLFAPFIIYNYEEKIKI